MSVATAGSDDRSLVDLCLAGDPAAIDRLIRRCHPRVLAVVTRRLGARHRDGELPAELAQRFWCWLVGRGWDPLGRFDPRLGSIDAYLGGLARGRVRAFFRQLRRVRCREARLAGATAGPAGPDWPVRLTVEEFSARLSPCEREYLRVELLGGRGARFSPAHRHKLAGRIRRKWLDFWGAV
jgi:DNA-directed RNA polymerase specialized sigma24 family protein